MFRKTHCLQMSQIIEKTNFTDAHKVIIECIRGCVHLGWVLILFLCKLLIMRQKLEHVSLVCFVVRLSNAVFLQERNYPYLTDLEWEFWNSSAVVPGLELSIISVARSMTDALCSSVVTMTLMTSFRPFVKQY